MADQGADAGPVTDQESDHDGLKQLFGMWDADNSGHLDFQEVRSKLRQLAPERGAASARNAAFEALLLADRDGNRKLNRDEFRHLMQRIAQAAELPLADAVQRLLSQEAGPADQPSSSSSKTPSHKHLRFAAKSTSVDPAPAQQHGGEAAAPPAAAAGSAPHPDQQQQQPLVQQALQRKHKQEQQEQRQQQDVRPKVVELFELFDRNGDGTVSFAELCNGLEKFTPQGSVHNKKSITTMITEATQVLLAHDADKDQRLNLSEFEAFIEAFMRATGGYTLVEVVDYLLTLQHTKKDNVCLQKVLAASEDRIQQQLTGTSSNAADAMA